MRDTVRSTRPGRWDGDLTTPNTGGQALDRTTRVFFEKRLGHDFSAIRIHTDDSAIKSAEALEARAYTLGQRVVFARGEYAPETSTGLALLAHELAHTVQFRDGTTNQGTSHIGTLARQPSKVRPGTAGDRRMLVETAARFLESMALQVETLRRVASHALVTTSGRAASARAFHRHLNQEIIEQMLQKAISVFEAQRSANPLVNFPAESPEQTRLGGAYARVLEQMGLAIQAAHANATNLAPAVEEVEERRYATNHVRLLDANPAAPLAAGIRTTFTAREVEISARWHQRVSTGFAHLASNLHRYNLAGTGARRLREALLNAVYRLVRDPVTGMASPRRDPTLEASLQPIMTQIEGIEWVLGRSIERLERTETRTRAFAAAPTRSQGVGSKLQHHFSTQDAGYATLLADRLARMARELRGGGSLAVHARNPQDSHCRVGQLGGLSMVAAHAEPNHFYFCGSPTIGDEGPVSTVIHEAAHAAIPSLGAKARLTSSSETPRDRAYAFERIYSRLSTEEALDNAESYAFYVDDVLGVQTYRAPAPTDTVTGCPDPDAVHDAIARATYRIRLGATWANSTLDTHRRTLPEYVVTIVRNGFPGADAARARTILVQMRGLATRLQYYLSVRCQRAGDREARAGALAYGRSIAASGTGVTATSRNYPAGTLRVCPAWFSAGTRIREDTMSSILVGHYRGAVPIGNVAGITSLTRYIQEQVHPSVASRSLQQHHAADVASVTAP